jgi:hypothetical protein
MYATPNAILIPVVVDAIQKPLLRASSPVELGILARPNLLDRRIATNRAPDLLLKLSGSDVIAVEVVVCTKSALIPHAILLPSPHPLSLPHTRDLGDLQQ